MPIQHVGSPPTLSGGGPAPLAHSHTQTVSLLKCPVRLSDSTSSFLSYNQNEETISRNSLRYLSKANFTHSSQLTRAPLSEGGSPSCGRLWFCSFRVSVCVTSFSFKVPCAPK